MVSLSSLKKVPQQIKSQKKGIVSRIYNNVVDIIAVPLRAQINVGMVITLF